MPQLSKTKQLLLEFLELIRSQNNNVEPIKVLRANAFKIGKANILVRTASDLGKRYFFGLNYINAEEISNLSNSFVAFICGNLRQIVFLPTSILVQHLLNISHDRNGEYKINFTRDLKLALRGQGNYFDCSEFVNNWDVLKSSKYTSSKSVDPADSIHTLVQGRILEIGNIRGFETYSPDKAKRFNQRKLDEISTLMSCPTLQYTDHKSLKNIDVIWFRRTNGDLYPEYAFEVEFSTGVWSGFGRLATLREYRTKLYVVTHDKNKFSQVERSFVEISRRYIHLIPDHIGLLYSAEKNLIQMRQEFNL